jgi:ribosomal protein S18 acetylase RimI-like enzyme
VAATDADVSATPSRLLRGTESPPRVSLVLPSPELLATVQPWFAGCWADVRGLPALHAENAPSPEAWQSDAPELGERRLVLWNDRAVGFISYRVDASGLTIDELAIEPGARNRTLGAEAVYALEAAYPAIREWRGLVPASNGLAIYFWLRIGYHPIFLAEHGVHGFTMVVRSEGGPLNHADGASFAAQ